MTAHREPDRLIEAFFEQGIDELPDRAYEAVRTQTEQTRQQVVLGPWREPDMSRYWIAGAAAAAMVVLAVLAVTLTPRPADNVGSGTTVTPSPPAATLPAASVPPASVAASAAASPAGEVRRLPTVSGPPRPLAAGTYLTPEGFEPAVSVTVPDGWFGGADRAGFSVGQGLNEVQQRYADAGLYLGVIGLEYDAAVAAFEELEGVEFTEPSSATTLDGHQATLFHANPISSQVVLHGIAPGADLTVAADRQIVVDVDGQTLLIRTELFGSAAEAVLTDVIESLRFP